MANWQFEWRHLQEDFLNGATSMESDFRVGFESISNFWYAELSDFQSSTILLKFPLLCEWYSGLRNLPSGTRETFRHPGYTSRVGIPVIPGGGTRELRVIPVIRGGTRKYRWYEERYWGIPGHRGDTKRYQRIPHKNGLTQCTLVTRRGTRY